MHLAYLNYLYGNDTARNHVYHFSEAAREQGAIVDVYSMNLATSATGPDAPNDPSIWSRLRQALKVRYRRFLHEPKELVWNLKYIRKEICLLRANPPEVLLVRDHFITSSCVVVARRLNLPLVMEFNAPAAEARLYRGEYFLIPGLATWLEGFKLRNADAVVVVSTALKDFLVEVHRLNPAKVTVVANGADVNQFRPNLGCYDNSFNFSSDRCVIGFVGSFQKWHGSEYLGRMASEVGRARDKVQFLFVGDGPELDSLRVVCEHLGERARFTGRVPHDQVPEWVTCIDVGVVADAGFYMSPLKIMEWMAAGRAVVAPRYDPIEEIIEDGVHGLLFSPGDQAELVAKVLRLVDDPKLREALGTAASQRVRSEFTWSHNASRVLEVCKQAVGSSKLRQIEGT